jgi:hypothetical protein
VVCQGPGQCNNSIGQAIDPAGAERKRGKGPEHFRASSVGRASTNVDFLPDLAPLQNGAIFLDALLLALGS